MNPGKATDLRETNRIFEEDVVAKGNFNALDRVYTSNARILPPGAEMIAGIEPIKAFWKQAAAAMGVTAVELRSVDVEFLGDTATEIGRATLVTGSGEVHVKYVVIWKKEDGVWKWHVDIWNPVA